MGPRMEPTHDDAEAIDARRRTHAHSRDSQRVVHRQLLQGMIETECHVVAKGAHSLHDNRAVVAVRIRKGSNWVAKMLFQGTVGSADFFIDVFSATSREDRVTIRVVAHIHPRVSEPSQVIEAQVLPYRECLILM